MKPVYAVQVEWVDSNGRGGWQMPSTAHAAKPSLVTSVGLLLEKDRERIVLGGSLDHDFGNVHNVLTIPRALVRSIQRLRTVNE